MLLVAVILLLYAYAMARGTTWLDHCSDEDFRLFIWEAEPHRTADALYVWLTQLLIVQLWAAEPQRVWLRIQGWVLYPWARRLEQVCREHLADSETRIILDLSRVRWISPGGRRLLSHLESRRVQIQRWPGHLSPLRPAADDD